MNPSIFTTKTKWIALKLKQDYIKEEYEKGKLGHWDNYNKTLQVIMVNYTQK